MRNFYCLILLMLLTIVGSAQPRNDAPANDNSCNGKNAEIMILGTYHMANPGLDAVNLKADDVLSNRRQSEINDLLDKISRFKPTKIAIEGAYGSNTWNDLYTKYLSGEYKLGRNEIEQIGFQLAKRLNHKRLYPVDYPMLMNGLLYSEVDFSKPEPAKDEKNVEKTPSKLSERDLLLRNSTVTEFLLHLNNDKLVREEHGKFYINQLASQDKVLIYKSADLITNWYKRNLRIFSNINRITESPNERILLLIGAGHLAILKDFAFDSPQFCLVESETYLK